MRAVSVQAGSDASRAVFLGLQAALCFVVTVDRDLGRTIWPGPDQYPTGTAASMTQASRLARRALPLGPAYASIAELPALVLLTSEGPVYACELHGSTPFERWDASKGGPLLTVGSPLHRVLQLFGPLGPWRGPRPSHASLLMGWGDADTVEPLPRRRRLRLWTANTFPPTAELAWEPLSGHEPVSRQGVDAVIQAFAACNDAREPTVDESEP